MSPYTPITLTHANLQRNVRILIGTIAGYHYAESTKSTHIYTTGGVFPVVETEEQIDQILKRLTTSQGDDNVGRDTTTR